MVRALVDGDAQAERWLDGVVEGRVRAVVPELIFPEVANALSVHVLAKELTLEHARAVLEAVVALPLAVVPMPLLVGAALDVALARGLSVYDACYAVLAEASDATLVTADRRLAALVAGAELL